MADCFDLPGKKAIEGSFPNFRRLHNPGMSSWMLLTVKLPLIGLAVWAASMASKRWGHRVGGWLAGMPVIVGPITGLLLVDLSPEQVRQAALATLVCQPALIVFLLVFAHTARWRRWGLSLPLALVAYGVTALALSSLARPEWVTVALALLSPELGRRAMPALSTHADAPVPLPRSELAWRVAVALGVAAAVLGGASQLPPLWSGVLLAAPIAGAVLPCFTLPRHGADATVRMLSGFTRGQRGFVAFFVALLVLLPWAHPALAWGLSLGAATAAASAGSFRRASMAPR
jgi:hypothetical protein